MRAPHARLFGIRQRIFALVAITALPLVAVAASFVADWIEHERSDVLRYVADLSRRSAARLDDEIGNIDTLLQALSRLVAADGEAVAANDRLLELVRSGLPGHVGVLAVFGADGRNVGLAPLNGADRPVLGPATLARLRGGRAGDALSVGEPSVGARSGQVQVLVTRPVRAEPGREVVGVVGATVILGGLGAILDRAGMTPEAVVQVVDDRGTLLVRLPDAADPGPHPGGAERWVTAHLASGFTAADTIWADGRRRMTASVRLSRLPWLVSVGLPAEPTLAELRRSTLQAGLLGSAALLVALLVAWVISGRIARPLRQLDADTRAFAESGFTHRSRIRSRSEIGRLAAAFNTMADRVEDASNRLRALGDEMATIIHASPVPILAVDQFGKATLWNRAAERLWGYRAEEVLGTRPLLDPPGAPETLALLFRRVLGGEAVVGLDLRLSTKDGRQVDVQAFAAPLSDPSGGTRGVVSLWLDRTEQNALEARLRQSQKMQAIGQLAGGIAHDINNILGVVVANLDLLKESSRAGSDDGELVDAALASALRGADLVQQLLAFSRQQPLELRPMDIVATLEKWTPLLRRTLGERTEVALALEPDLWTVTADPAQLEICALNLALNARDAMPDGGKLSISGRNLTVGTEVAAIASGLAAGDYVVLSVTDSGTGIAPENLARAFEPFFTTKEPGKGSGLGLSMVFGYMRQSGGTAKIYSEPGHGTTVQLYLPRAASPADRRERTDGGETPAAGGGERILVVDDNPDMRGASVAMLRSLGYRTVEAGSAQEALATIETCGPFDLVFSDIVMPGEMTGIDLAHEARRRGIRILLASGFASPVTVRTEAATQGLVVLTKPFRKSDLAAQVRALLRQDPDAGGASLP